MVAFEPQSHPERREPPRQNVRGLERLLSIGGGLLLAALGASKHGQQGKRQLSVAGLLVLRGLSGHCSVKSALDDPLEEIRYLRQRVQRLQDLVLMAEEVAERTRAPAVTPVPMQPASVQPAPQPVPPVPPAAPEFGTPIADEFASREQSR